MTARFLRVQPGEGRSVGLVVSLMFVTSLGQTIGESGVSALFFDRVGADALPLMYLAQGATGFAAVIALTGGLGRFDRRRAYSAIPILIVAVVLAERAVLGADPGWIYPVLWLTVTVAVLLQSIFLWGTAGLVTDTRRAKRLFPLFGAGGILGSVVGGLLTRPLAATIGTANLLFVWAISLVGAAILCAAVLGVRMDRSPRRAQLRRRPPSALGDIRQGLSYVRHSRLLVWMTAAAVLFSVLFYSLYLPYAQAATVRFPDPEELAGFFGVFWASVTAAAFLGSVLLTNRLLGWFGAAAMVLVLPVLYAGGFGVLLVSSSFATLVAVRFGVTVWLQGVSSPAWETLVNVVPETRRDQVRAFLNGGPTQAGTAIAGIVTLVGQQALTPLQLSVIGLAVASITIVVTWRIRRSYARALAEALRAGRPSVFEGDAVEGALVSLDRDAQAVGLALEASGDPDPHVRRLAVEMLAQSVADARARDTLVRLVEDDDAVVRARAIRALGRADSLDRSLSERALGDRDAWVRRAAVRALGHVSSDPAITSRLRRLTEDTDPSVAAASCVALLEGPASDEAAGILRRLLSHPDADVRAATLRQLVHASPAVALELVEPMLDDGSPTVRAQAFRTLGSASPESAVPRAVDALDSLDGAVRDAAFEVLSRSDLHNHEAALLHSARAHGSLATRDHDLARSIPPNGDAPELLRDALMDRCRRNARAALSTLALLSQDRDAMRAAIDNLRETEQTQLANALETLETSEHRSLIRPLLPLWESEEAPATRRDDWLAVASRDQDPMIRACAELVRPNEGMSEDMARARTSMSPIERVLALRKIPLFAELSPADLQSVAAIAEERTYADGDVIAGEGEVGDELHLVTDGTVHVVRGTGGATSPVARRGPGDVVGEMSIITRTPRIASLVAEGDVRTLRIGHREFESMIRERPEVSLAVMRVLAERLGAQTVERDGPGES